MVTQQYQTDAHSVYVIVGNSALIKCEIPSFVADFVSVYSWTDDKNNEYFMGINKNYGKKLGCILTCSSLLRLKEKSYRIIVQL